MIGQLASHKRYHFCKVPWIAHITSTLVARCTVQCLTVTSKDGQVSTLPTLMPPEERWKTWQLPLVHLVDDASS